MSGPFAKGSSATRSLASESLGSFSPRSNEHAFCARPSGTETGEGGGVSAFLGLWLRRSGLESARRSHLVGDDGVEGEDERQSEVAELVRERT